MNLLDRQAILVAVVTATSLSTVWGQNFTLEGGVVAGGGGSSTAGRFGLAGFVGEAWAGRAVDPDGDFGLLPGFVLVETLSWVPKGPPLEVAREGQNILLSWNRTESLYLLQESTDPVGWTWSDASVVPRLDREKWTVVVPATGARSFRLMSAAPVLSILESDDALEIAWASPDPRFVLQENLEGLAVEGWRDVATAVRPEADRWLVKLPVGTGTGFYRLRSR